MEFSILVALSASLLAGGMGLATVLSRKRSLPHWFFAAGMFGLAAESACSAQMVDAVLARDLVYWHAWKLCFASVLPGLWLGFSLTYARGNAREFLRRWRWPLTVVLFAPLLLSVVFRGNTTRSVSRLSATGAWVVDLSTAGNALHLLFLLSALLVLVNLERTYRAAVGTMRWRIKFLILGIGTIFAVRAYTSTQVLLFHATSPLLQTVNSLGLLLGCSLVIRSLVRTGQFEVAVYPSHAALQNSLTLLLSGFYLLSVGVFAKLVVALGGDSAFQIKALFILVALVFLSVLLVSDRVRLWLKRLVSRHFQRPLHDYRTVWRSFTKSTMRCLEETDLCAAITKLLSEVFQALSVTLWLVDERKERFFFGASTSVSQAKARQLVPEPVDAVQIISALCQRPGPFDLENCREPWASPLRRLHPEEFHRLGSRICVPMFAGGELLGALIIGDRVGDVPFSEQDLDLLKSVSDQAAANLLNIRLTQRLSQGKQLEAFQAMSAFFVHDLKNTASTLSLMLRNFPAHYQEKEFCEDALRGISKTVAHINDLIRRLGVLRHDLSICPASTDLNQVVAEALKEEIITPGVELISRLGSVPKVCVDGVQIQKVVTNLLLNARDALGSGGQIRVETSQSNGWVVLAVTDNGCGMSREFIDGSLFRPFQTTKKNGVGIGMFHCKTLIEAQRGRIDVESEPGKGTSVRVLLPPAEPANSPP